MKKSWKTSVFGAGGVVAIVGAVLNALFDGDPSTNVDWITTLAGLAPSIGLMFSRDYNVSSEQSGIKPSPIADVADDVADIANMVSKTMKGKLP